MTKIELAIVLAIVILIGVAWFARGNDCVPSDWMTWTQQNTPSGFYWYRRDSKHVPVPVLFKNQLIEGEIPITADFLWWNGQLMKIQWKPQVSEGVR